MGIPALSLDDPIEVKYKRVQKMIYGLCHKFAARYNGEWDDLLSSANVGFMRAVKKWDPSRAAFTTWCYHKVRHQLLTDLGEKMQRDSRFPSISLSGTDDEDRDGFVPENRREFDLEEFKGSLSPDAARAVDTLLAVGKPCLKFRRSAAVKFLQEMGWCGERIMESFSEIREALNS